MASPRETIIHFVDEYLASEQTGLDVNLLEARIHLGGTLTEFSEDRLAIAINQVIGHYRSALGQARGKDIEQILDDVLLGQRI